MRLKCLKNVRFGFQNKEVMKGFQSANCGGRNKNVLHRRVSLSSFFNLLLWTKVSSTSVHVLSSLCRRSAAAAQSAADHSCSQPEGETVRLPERYGLLWPTADPEEWSSSHQHVPSCRCGRSRSRWAHRCQVTAGCRTQGTNWVSKIQPLKLDLSERVSPRSEATYLNSETIRCGAVNSNLHWLATNSTTLSFISLCSRTGEHRRGQRACWRPGGDLQEWGGGLVRRAGSHEDPELSLVS